ncbi:hypothetical protein [Sphaerochaeta globosa]|nr:hypothetical protein [Sphaerochaeta globosa]
MATLINVSQKYLDRPRLLKMKDFRRDMTIMKFLPATKMNLQKKRNRI